MPHKSGVRNIYLCRDAMYSSNNLRTHFGPPSSSQASRWAWVSGRHEALTLPALHATQCTSWLHRSTILDYCNRSSFHADDGFSIDSPSTVSLQDSPVRATRIHHTAGRLVGICGLRSISLTHRRMHPCRTAPIFPCQPASFSMGPHSQRERC